MLPTCRVPFESRTTRVFRPLPTHDIPVYTSQNVSLALPIATSFTKHKYRIYSNKRRGAYLIFRATSAALITGRRLFKHCTRQIYFFYIFIQRHTFYLLIFLWTDTKLIVNLEVREKFMR